MISTSFFGAPLLIDSMSLTITLQPWRRAACR